MFIDGSNKTNGSKTDLSQGYSSYTISNSDTFNEEYLMQLIHGEEQKDVEASAQALHELLNIREKKILEKSLRLVAGRIVGVNKEDYSYNVQPIGSFYEENGIKSTLNTGVWSGINSVCIFQNLSQGDEVILLTNSSKNKVNSIIIGVYQQKSKDKFQNLINVIANLVEDNKRLKKIEEDCKQYKKDISTLKDTVKDLKERISAIENMLDGDDTTTS